MNAKYLYCQSYRGEDSIISLKLTYKIAGNTTGPHWDMKYFNIETLTLPLRELIYCMITHHS